MVESQFPQLFPIGASNELTYYMEQKHRTHEANIKKLVKNDEDSSCPLAKDEFAEKGQVFLRRPYSLLSGMARSATCLRRLACSLL